MVSNTISVVLSIFSVIELAFDIKPANSGDTTSSKAFVSSDIELIFADISGNSFNAVSISFSFFLPIFWLEIPGYLHF